MHGRIELDAAISQAIDKLVAEYISENILRKTVVITHVYKVNTDFGRKPSTNYTVEFQDAIEEMANGETNKV